MSNWKIEIKNFEINQWGVSGGEHLYYEFWNGDGIRIAQFNGLATSINTGSIEPFGVVDTHTINAYEHPNGYFDEGANFYETTQPGVIVFEGSQAQAEAALNTVRAAGGWINQQHNRYDGGVGHYNDVGQAYNSNSVFMAFTKAIEAAGINISPELLDQADNLNTTFLGDIGLDKDIFRGSDAWKTSGDSIWRVEKINGKDVIIKYEPLSSKQIIILNTNPPSDDATVVDFGTENGKDYITWQTENGAVKQIGTFDGSGKLTVIEEVHTFEGDGNASLSVKYADADNDGELDLAQLMDYKSILTRSNLL